ncbi:D-glycero-alpha-D-manno-heptose-1,7-bisphosphate 7-phosphatase [Mitsuokella sp. oral taxon 131]|uniref:D-glycero-alpha-D-manno-heptose-1,7-bisphosphate 7-phosphatase n=1 Tax=Mitsuokella sp. oral taxon 131 TaxID=1321780 RepID=UPI0003AE7414|nr:HAD family hydrolase [Mitsuokella sp. oral taxon 131]ERL04121.1 D,D-heptose 1,7-bisphosphate phosphatase [Mitsuokella sp. oral taxon 131 str. W9106]
MANKAVFFDRDGTLNRDVGYLHRIEDFIWMPGAKEAVRYVNGHGYLAVVATNQSGVARGYYKASDVVRVYDWMNETLAASGAHLDALYYCPHYVGGKIAKYAKPCDCRKPKTGMVDAACAKYDIDRAASYLVGDSETDMACAENAGLKGIRYAGGDLLALVKGTVK